MYQFFKSLIDDQLIIIEALIIDMSFFSVVYCLLFFFKVAKINPKQRNIDAQSNLSMKTTFLVINNWSLGAGGLCSKVKWSILLTQWRLNSQVVFISID